MTTRRHVEMITMVYAYRLMRAIDEPQDDRNHHASNDHCHDVSVRPNTVPTRP